MATVFRIGTLLYIVTYIAMREILTHTTDLAWLPNVLLSIVVGVAVAATGEALATRLRARRAPEAPEASEVPVAAPVNDDAAARLVSGDRVS